MYNGLTNSNSREPTILTTLSVSKGQGIEPDGREIPVFVALNRRWGRGW